MTIPIATFTGKLVDVHDLRPQDIELADVAHSLALVCRWSGHTRRFYSVAEHCVRVSYEAEALGRERSLAPHLVKRVAFEGLMHDGEEAYPPGDIATPFKQHAASQVLVEVQERIRAAICSRFGLGDELPELVHRADRVLLATEARDLMAGDWMPADCEPQRHPLQLTWSPGQAELIFLRRFQELSDESDGAGDDVREALQHLLPPRWVEVDSIENRYPPAHPREDAVIISMMLRELQRKSDG